MTLRTGGCACGRTRFETRGAPKFSFLCHCADCRRTTGGAHAPWTGFDAADFSVDGPLGRFDRRAASGNNVHQYFCSECGSPIYGTTTRAPDTVMILTGVFDDPADLPPRRSVFTEEMLPWDRPVA